MPSDVGAYRIDVPLGALLLLVTQCMAIKDKCEGFILIISLLVVRLSIDNLKLRQSIPDAAIEDIFDK